MVMSRKIINGKKYYHFGTMTKQNANVFIKQTKDYDKLLGHKRLLRKFKITSNFRKGMYAVYMTQYL